MIGDLRAFIVADAGVTALLGQRVFFVRRHQAEGLPAATLNTISRLDDVHMGGPSGYIATRVQVDVYGSTYTSARACADALIARLHGHAGTQGSTVFQLIRLDGENDGFEAGDTETDRPTRISLDFLVHYGSTP